MCAQHALIVAVCLLVPGPCNILTESCCALTQVEHLTAELAAAQQRASKAEQAAADAAAAAARGASDLRDENVALREQLQSLKVGYPPPSYDNWGNSRCAGRSSAAWHMFAAFW